MKLQKCVLSLIIILALWGTALGAQKALTEAPRGQYGDLIKGLGLKPTINMVYSYQWPRFIEVRIKYIRVVDNQVQAYWNLKVFGTTYEGWTLLGPVNYYETN